MMKRCISFLLCLFLTATLIPWTAFATEASSPEKEQPEAGHTPITGTMNISNRQSGDGSISFDAHLDGSEITGGVFVALYNEAGQMCKVETRPAAQSVAVEMEYAQESDSIKVMWLDDNLAPVCPAETVDVHVPEIYAKALDEEHITETEIEVDGKTVATKYVDNEVIIEAAEGVTKAQIEELVRGCGGSVVGYLEEVGYYQIELYSVSTISQLNDVIQALKTNSLISDAYLNSVREISTNSMPFYPYDGDGWRGADWDENNPAGKNWSIEATYVPSAWQLLIEKFGKINAVPSIKIGIIDDLFDKTHDDVKFEAVWSWLYNFQKLTGKSDTDHTAERAREIEIKDEKTSQQYKNIVHGTHVAGIIGAETDNGKGTSGVALHPELYGVALQFKESIMTEYPQNTSASTFAEYAALTALIEREGVKIINYSYGHTPKDTKDIDAFKASVQSELDVNVPKISDYLRRLLKKHDFLIVTAAGNRRKLDAHNNNEFSAIDDGDIKKHIVVVGASALTEDGNMCWFQSSYNYGTRIDVVAPGENISSTVPCSKNSNKTVYSMSGTSMASPHVAGVAALVWTANSSLTGEDVKQILVDAATTELEDGGYDARPDEEGGPVSHKMINAQEAVELALHEIYGEVVDVNTGKPIQRIDVTLDYKVGTDSKTLSFSAGGQFRKQIPVQVEDLKNIQHESLKISAEGYEDVTLSLSGNTHKTINVGTIQMEPKQTNVPADAFYFNGHAYKVFNQSMTWIDAKSFCEHMGGHLVTITSEEEQKFLNALDMDSNLFWIGLYFEANQWRWVTAEPIVYTNWSAGEPSSSFENTEFFAEMYGSSYDKANLGEWNDAKVDGGTVNFYSLQYTGFICEWESTTPVAQKQWTILGNSYYDEQSDCFVLTEDYKTYQNGSIRFDGEHNGDFVIDFDYYTGTNNRALGGADGIWVDFYDYKTQKGKYGVELDTYFNDDRGDPSYNHIALFKYPESGDILQHLAIAELPESEDEVWHHLKIAVKNQQCSAYVDGRLKFTCEIEQAGYGRIIIAGYTGGGVNLHAVKNIRIE